MASSKFTLGSLLELALQLHGCNKGAVVFEESRLQDELLAFYHTFMFLDGAFDQLFRGIPEIEYLLEICWHLCRARYDQEDQRSSTAPFLTLGLQASRMRILIEYCCRIM